MSKVPLPPGDVLALIAAYEILEGFEGCSAYEDYQDEVGFSNAEYYGAVALQRRAMTLRGYEPGSEAYKRVIRQLRKRHAET